MQIMQCVRLAEGYTVGLTDQGNLYVWGNWWGRLEQYSLEHYKDDEQYPSNFFGLVLLHKQSNLLVGFDAGPGCGGAETDDNVENKFIDVKCGLNFSTALTSQGEVYVWGSNQEGQHGTEVKDIELIYRNLEIDNLITIPQEYDYSTKAIFPHMIPEFGIRNARPVTGIACGYKHVIAIINHKSVFSWGSNLYGQLGIMRKD
jgi:alpha-tubulin suppressor-like RCC1 family protein